MQISSGLLNYDNKQSQKGTNWNLPDKINYDYLI